jgi:hypothetical protein
MTTFSRMKAASLPIASLTFAFALGLVAAPRAAAAQDAPAQRGDAHGECDCHHGVDDGAEQAGGHHAQRSPAERLARWQQRLARVSERLQLNASQRGAAQQLLSELLARAERERAVTAPRTPERREARRALMAQADARFTALLDARQRTAWEQLKVELRARHAGRHHGGRHPGGRHGRPGRGPRSDAARGI